MFSSTLPNRSSKKPSARASQPEIFTGFVGKKDEIRRAGLHQL
jgi:hypothetical protein